MTKNCQLAWTVSFLHSDQFPEGFRGAQYYKKLTSLFSSTIVGAENPPLTVLRKFAYLLDQSDLDFQEELEVTRLREEVVTKIRSNQQLEKDLNLMDIKIGLLVKNRITLQVSRLCSGSLSSTHWAPPHVGGTQGYTITAEAERDLWRSSGPDPLSKQGHPEQVVQMADYLQQWRLHNLSNLC